VNAVRQYSDGGHGVVGVLGTVVQEAGIVSVCVAAAGDGLVVHVGAEHGSEVLEGSLGTQLIVKVVEDGEIEE
jgi:hypothetical protein